MSFLPYEQRRELEKLIRECFQPEDEEYFNELMEFFEDNIKQRCEVNNIKIPTKKEVRESFLLKDGYFNKFATNAIF
jgi:hypothetical protein